MKQKVKHLSSPLRKWSPCFTCYGGTSHLGDNTPARLMGHCVPLVHSVQIILIPDFWSLLTFIQRFFLMVLPSLLHRNLGTTVWPMTSGKVAKMTKWQYFSGHIWLGQKLIWVLSKPFLVLLYLVLHPTQAVNCHCSKNDFNQGSLRVTCKKVVQLLQRFRTCKMRHVPQKSSLYYADL